MTGPHEPDRTGLNPSEGDAFAAFGAFGSGLVDDFTPDDFGLVGDLHDPDDDELLDGLLDDVEDPGLAPPVHWPSVDVDDAGDRMVELWTWVAQFQRRFPETVRLPDCWPHHNSLVELLQALLDHERASFSELAPPTAAVGWHLAVRDVEHRIRDFMSNLACREVAANVDEVHQPPREAPSAASDEHLRQWLTSRGISGTV